eukprot:scaffold74257_cov51-Phaeocystis_antarctica.AAC.1
MMVRATEGAGALTAWCRRGKDGPDRDRRAGDRGHLPRRRRPRRRLRAEQDHRGVRAARRPACATQGSNPGLEDRRDSSATQTQGSNPGPADKVPGRSCAAAHTCQPRLGQRVARQRRRSLTSCRRRRRR